LNTYKEKIIFLLISLVSFCFAIDISNFKFMSKTLLSEKEEVTSEQNAGDNYVDPETYIIGSGDVFLISVIESPSTQYTGTVNENCDVYIPDLGIIKVGRKNLSLAKEIISQYVASKLKKQLSVYTSLVRTKKATVTVSGAVSAPGTYRLSGTSRLLDAIKLANNNILPNVNDYNFREVECRNKDTVKYYDVFKYLLQNDLSQNPYIYPGDNIFLSYPKERVFLYGAIKNPVYGLVPIKKNESLKEFLSNFTFDASADSSYIFVQSKKNDGSYERKLFSFNSLEQYFLKDRDYVVIYEKQNYASYDVVMVKGEVKRQGPYPFVKNVTKAEDIIEMAGGPTKDGNIDRAYIIRHKKKLSEEMKKSYSAFKPAMSSMIFDNSVRPEINAGFFRMTTSNDFVIIKLKENKNIILETDDEIVIPKKEYFVYVSGSVCKPGAYSFIDGKSKDYYISQAGGFTSKADKSNVFVVGYYQDVIQLKENGNIEEGDVIVVPDSQQYKFFTMVFLPLISTLAAIISTSFAIYSATK
jgi:protein involved in polysaccharide export with SLBB domain